MKVLGLDTATSCGCVGLIDDERIISEYLLDIPVTHSERLLGAIELVLREAHCAMEDLDGWAISLGPGSFTGLRIGVSTVKGLAFANRKPVTGVSTLDVLASQTSPTPFLICPILDARKGEVYTAFYRYDERIVLRRLSAYRAIKPEVLVKQFLMSGISPSNHEDAPHPLPSPSRGEGEGGGENLFSMQMEEKTIFIGDGVRTYGDYLRDALPSFAMFPPPSLHVPHGAVVARLGLEHLRKGDVLDLSTFTPIYVRPSEAEMKWGEKHPDG
jgi:tRNA threonylcarbamoyladenosine biosynthesis protein TsaB